MILHTHKYRLKILSLKILPYVEHATLVNNHEDSVTHVKSIHETNYGAPNDSCVAISDKNKAQDVNHNIVHVSTHHDSISHRAFDQLSVCERQNL